MNQQPREIIKRLSKAIDVSTLADLARFLGVGPSAINGALRKDQIPELWIYKIAVQTGCRVEWLREGTEPQQYVELLKDAGAVTDQLWKLQAEIERIATNPEQRLRLVHTVQDAASLLQAVTVSEAASQYNLHGENQVELSALDPEGKATVHRLIQALLHGDQQIKTHLIGQLKIIEDAVVARKKKDSQHTAE